jgi:hypothetical protein
MRAAGVMLCGLAAATLAGCAGGSSSSPTQRALSQIWSQEAALTFALRDVCLAAKSSGRPEADFAIEPSALAVEGRRAPAVPGRAWFVGSGTYVVDQDQPDACYVRVENGDGPKMRDVAVSILEARAPGFTQGRSGLALGGEVLRTSYCTAQGEGRLMALVSSRRAARGAGPAIQISVFEADPSSAQNCQSNGPGDGSERNY